MKCTQCNATIWEDEEYITWGGFLYCGTACIVETLKENDGLEEVNK